MKKLCLALYSVFFTTLVFAQEEYSLTEPDPVPSNDAWYASPWLWLAGAALIIVLLVVLSNRKEKRE